MRVKKPKTERIRMAKGALGILEPAGRPRRGKVPAVLPAPSLARAKRRRGIVP